MDYAFYTPHLIFIMTLLDRFYCYSNFADDKNDYDFGQLT